MELLSGPSLREEIGLGGAFAPDRAIPVLEAVGAPCSSPTTTASPIAT